MASKTDWRERQAERLDELSSGLYRQMEKYTSSGEWTRFMRAVGAMPKRSLRNQLLILAQHEQAHEKGLVPTESPSLVLGFWDWKQRGRSVNKGQHGYRVFQPLIGKFIDPVNR